MLATATAAGYEIAKTSFLARSAVVRNASPIVAARAPGSPDLHPNAHAVGWNHIARRSGVIILLRIKHRACIETGISSIAETARVRGDDPRISDRRVVWASGIIVSATGRKNSYTNHQ